MSSLSDRLLDSGCALHVDVIHGEPVRILTGVEAGKTFYAVRETVSDFVMDTDLGQDPRAKRMLRFRDSAGAPHLGSQDEIETEDGKRWTAVRNPGDGFLTTDYELQELAPCDR